MGYLEDGVWSGGERDVFGVSTGCVRSGTGSMTKTRVDAILTKPAGGISKTSKAVPSYE